MKIFLFLIMLLNIAIVNAEINIFQETYSPKETFQAELVFKNLVENIKPENILILDSNNKKTDIGILFSRISDEKYFIYFNVPEIEDGDYFLKVNNIKYIENGILKKEGFVKEFKIKNRKDNLISISPPFMTFKINERNFFKVDVKNNGDEILNLKVSEESNSTNIFNNNLTIAKNSEASFYFTIFEDLISDREKINIKLSYNDKLLIIPVYILTAKEKGELLFHKTDKEYIDSFYIEIPSENYAEVSLFLENKDENIFNLTLSLSENLKKIMKLGFYQIAFLETNKSLELTLFINQDRNAEVKIYSGYLEAKNNEIESSLPITVKFSEVKLEENKILDAEEEEAEEEIPTLIPLTLLNETITPKKKIDNKKLTYIIIISIITLFSLMYLLLYIKTGKKKYFRKH